jgi:hypothetical protein
MRFNLKAEYTNATALTTLKYFYSPLAGGVHIRMVRLVHCLPPLEVATFGNVTARQLIR